MKKLKKNLVIQTEFGNRKKMDGLIFTSFIKMVNIHD